MKGFISNKRTTQEISIFELEKSWGVFVADIWDGTPEGDISFFTVPASFSPSKILCDLNAESYIDDKNVEITRYGKKSALLAISDAKKIRAELIEFLGHLRYKCDLETVNFFPADEARLWGTLRLLGVNKKQAFAALAKKEDILITAGYYLDARQSGENVLLLTI